MADAANYILDEGLTLWSITQTGQHPTLQNSRLVLDLKAGSTREDAEELATPLDKLVTGYRLRFDE